MKKIIGGLMIAAPFVLIFAGAVIGIGLVEALLMFAGIALGGIWVFLALTLLLDW